MPSEELESRYPENQGRKVESFELFQTQLTTLNQFAEHGIIPNVNYHPFNTQKCDALLISRAPVLRAVLVGEDKSTGKLTAKNWKGLAKDLLETKINPTNSDFGYLTDGSKTYWVCGARSEVSLITREDGKPLPQKIDFKNKTFVAELVHLINHYDRGSGIVKKAAAVNPQALAQSVWQTIWRLKADRPEDCLATFVELFVYKFLNDLNLMQKTPSGQDVSIDYLLSLDKLHCYGYYNATIRPHIKQLFPAGKDGLSIINGTVFQPTNKDHNFIFHEVLKRFVRFGSLKNTDPEFKTRLYESFLQASDTTTTFGQFFTPRKVVGAIHDMAQIDKIPAGHSICDPAGGVGGFMLEQMARDLDSQWKKAGDEVIPIHEWHAFDIVPKTTILAKANALVHCGDLLADQPGRIASFSRWLNATFECKEQTALGTLDGLATEEFDVILTNPPFVVSGSADVRKLIEKNPARKQYFARKYSGLEGLFVQYIVQALKSNGDAWVLLPETFFLRTTDKALRDWVFEKCQVDLLALLPERTFFNTPKRVVVVHLKKRKTPLSPDGLAKALAKEKILLFAVGEIGETRDARRLPISENNLPELVEAYKWHAAGAPLPEGLKQAVLASALEVRDSRSINIRHYWEKADAQALGLLGQDEDPLQARKALTGKMDSLGKAIDAWRKASNGLAAPATPAAFKPVSLGNETYFDLTIGKRVLKKDIFQKQTSIPLYSANVRKPFGCVDVANAGNLENGGVLWSIDSDFDCVGVSPGEIYSITDHCGQATILVPGIEPRYLATQIRQAGTDMGLNRDYRASLNAMADISVDLPVLPSGDFDYQLMKEWSDFQEAINTAEASLKKLV